VAVAAVSIQRLVEQQAASRGDAIAIVHGEHRLSYHELNQRANAVARHLSGNGFRPGCHAIVRLRRGPELATVLLAILKAGGSYTWIEAAGEPAVAGSVTVGRRGSDDQFLPMDLGEVLAGDVHSTPNLPILTRGSDIACVLPDRDGRAAVLVPHATVTSLTPPAPPGLVPWSADAGALDLWAGLMAGATVTIDDLNADSRAA
jgi:hypothetical protein